MVAPGQKYAPVDRESVSSSAAAVLPAMMAAAAATDAAIPGMGHATLGSCFVALTNTILGSGMLGLPHAFAACGYLLGSVLLLASGGISAFALHLLSCSASTIWDREHGPRTPVSFHRVAELAVPRFAWLIDLAVAIKCFGVGCSYLIVIGDLMPEAMEFLTPESELLQSRQLWISIAWLLLAAPLSCMRTLDGLKVTNQIAIGCVIMVTGLVIVYSLGVVDPCLNLPASRGVCVGDTALVIMDMSTAKVLTVFTFAFTCHQNIFAVANEIEQYSPARVDRVICIAIGTAVVLYCLVAIAGYCTYGAAVGSDILTTYPENLVISVARILISLLVVFSYPLQCHPARSCVTALVAACRDDNPSSEGTPKPASGGSGEGVESVDNTEGTEMVALDSHGVPIGSAPAFTTLHVGLTTCYLLGTFVVANVIGDLGVILSIVGATGSTLVSYILPGSCYYFLHPDERSAKRTLSLIMFVCGCIIVPFALAIIFV
jgi:amino acid permease